MRILCYLHAPDLGGVERTALRLCHAWSIAGADVAVALGRSDGLRPQAAGMRLLPAPRLPFSTAPFETLWMMWWLATAIRRERPDVLFCAGNSYAVVAIAMRLLFGPNCPPIVAKASNDHVRADMPWPALALYMLWCRVQGRLIDHFVALSVPMRDQLKALLGVPRARLSVVANPALDDEMLAAFADAGERARASRGMGRRFVTAGRLAPQKNQTLMIEAFARGAAPEDRLLIVGDGPMRRQLARQVNALGLEDRVLLSGPARHATQWLSACDVFLLSSDYEGLPAVVVEALAAGIAVIATDCCASIEGLLGGGALGTLVPPGDVAVFALAIAEATPDATDPIAARTQAASFRTSAAAAQFLRLLHAVATRTPAVNTAVPFPIRETA